LAGVSGTQIINMPRDKVGDEIFLDSSLGKKEKKRKREKKKEQKK
jgi:rRNA processing protein Gar1